ncbi:hypothetical protein K469DRAFT_602926, partial [Zopfia rhizophila CBS 207.26]
WRFEEIPAANQRTFLWVFGKPEDMQVWNDFSDHLARGNALAPHFINGKANGGKSTLMRFIVENSETKDALDRWSEVKNWLWNLGTSL